MPGAKYELLAVAFGGKGRSVSTTQELEAALTEMLSDNNLWVLNVLIDSSAMMKAAKFGWLTSSKDISKPQDVKL
jgi:thiamine pyrophosphate-dependent acetolactate synthase large subunit-like protein